MNGFLTILTIISALGSGLIVGIFFAFSTFIMTALNRLPPSAGIAAMQSVNEVILKSLFMPVFFGTAITSALLMVYSLWRWHESSALYLFFGGVFYLIGCLLVTMMFNVPKNKVLAVVAATDPKSAGLWLDYVKQWTIWNHIRTVASLVAAASFSMALSC